VAAPRLGFAGRRVRDTANPAGFIASPVTNAAFAAHEHACFAGYTNIRLQSHATVHLM